MDKQVEQQRAHFDQIAERYHSARINKNHLLVKDLIWRHFFNRHPELLGRPLRVLEPMCGAAEAFRILSRHVGFVREYAGFDYSDTMVEFARQQNPGLRIWHGDVTSYRGSGETYDLIILIGGLHHVFARARQVLRNLHEVLAPNGLFISLEPTHDNWLWRRLRKRIYEENDLFDADTEEGFEYSELRRHFTAAGFRTVDEVFPGLLAYVLYYNPDAFPALNIGGQYLVKSAFVLDRLIWASPLGRKLSFATLGLWAKE